MDGVVCVFPAQAASVIRITKDTLAIITSLVKRFELDSLRTTLRVCESLAAGAPVDIAVIGQFKAGKSSFLNALLGEDIFPIGALPVTAVVTRARSSNEHMARVTFLSGGYEDVPISRLSEFVTERENPDNARKVAIVDVLTPAMNRWPGIRLVDTPGLGSVFAHNTQATSDWLPNVTVAVVIISAERPLSAEDRQLLTNAQRTASRVVVVLSKIDLVSEAEREGVIEFIRQTTSEHLGIDVPVLPLSCRIETEQCLRPFREIVLQPVAADVEAARQSALQVKLRSLVQACRQYLTVGLVAAEQTEADREHLRRAVFSESVNAIVLDDELVSAERRICSGARREFENFFADRRRTVEGRLREALVDAMSAWQGNLARRVQLYEKWMAQRLLVELTPISEQAASLAIDILARVEQRLRRVVEAFRDRLGKNIQDAMQVTISSVTWEPALPAIDAIPVALSQTFATSWELLWWLLPMQVFGPVFRRHVLHRITWEVEKNLSRLVGRWTEVVEAAGNDLRIQASEWAKAELTTLAQLLERRSGDAAEFREALQRLE